VKQLIKDKNLDHPEQSILTIYTGPEQFSFSIYNPEERGSCFYEELSPDHPIDAFSAFKDAFFEYSFFSLPFRKVRIMNRTPMFAFIPQSMYKDNCGSDFMEFLFSNQQGILLSNSVSSAGITVLYQLPEDVHQFMIRSFEEPEFIHYSTPVISCFLSKSKQFNGCQMVVNLQKNGLDIFCFSKKTFLLGNYFPCKRLSEALYYILFTWKQLRFNQLNDYLHIAGNSVFKDELIKKLTPYLQQIHTAAISPEIQFEGVNTGNIPFELAALSLCEL